MKNMTVYDSLLPAFRGVFRADPFEMLERVFDDEYFPAFTARCPVVDVSEKDGRYLFEVELPGVSEKELKLELKDGVLTLSTEKKEEQGGEGLNGAVAPPREARELLPGSFELPEDADGEKIEASFKDGLLKIELPKKPEASPRLVPVKAA